MRIVLFDLQTGGHHIQYVQYLTQFLCELGHEVTFVTLKEDIRTRLLPSNEQQLAVRFIDDSAEAKVKSTFIFRHRQMTYGLKLSFDYATEWGADIVTLMYVDYNALSVFINSLSWNKRSWRLFGFLVWPHFIYGRDEYVPLLRRLYYRLTAAIMKNLLMRGFLNGIFVHTEAIRQALIQRFDWADSEYASRLIVVPDPAEMFDGHCSIEDARARIQLPEGLPILLFFGGLRWDKGPDVLLEAIRDCKSNFILLIAGQPDYLTLADIEAYVERHSISQKIIARIQYIAREDVKYYFLGADAIVLPYRTAFRGTSGILQNAAAAGKPVIAADVGEIGRIVREHSLGVVTEPESPASLTAGIDKLLSELQPLQENVRERALQYARENNWRIMARKVWEAYTEASDENEE